MSRAVDDFEKRTQEEAELNRKKAEVQKRRTESEYNRYVEADEEAEKAKSISFKAPSQSDIERYQRENEKYMTAAREAKVFINDDFTGVIPFFRKNLILMCSVSGEGKTTCVANAIKSGLLQGMRGIVFTNEEMSEDLYNRVTSLIKRWPYTNHNKIPVDRVPVYSEFIGKLAPRLTIVDDGYGAAGGTTTTLEGAVGAMDKLLEEYRETGKHYDYVIFDYFQNYERSRDNPHMESWKVLERLAKHFDKFKNAYPAPIVVMSQLTPDAEGKMPFKLRIEGRKSILNPATCAVEIRADRKNARTEWIIHKSRYTEAMGSSFFTGYDKGEYVKYDAKFIADADNRATLKGVFKGKK